MPLVLCCCEATTTIITQHTTGACRWVLQHSCCTYITAHGPAAGPLLPVALSPLLLGRPRPLELPLAAWAPPPLGVAAAYWL